MRYVILIVGVVVIVALFQLGHEVGYNMGYLRCEEVSCACGND